MQRNPLTAVDVSFCHILLCEWSINLTRYKGRMHKTGMKLKASL